jgi:WD40 repeat protein
LTSAGPAITGLAFSVDGNWLAAVAGDLDANRQPSLLRMWELATKQEFVLHQNAKGALSAVAFSPDGKTLATTGFYPATAVNVWDTRGALVATLGDHVNAGRSVAFLPDGGRVVSSGGDGALRLWLLRAGASRAFRLGPASGQILQALVSPEGRHIITANGNGTVSVLRIAPNSFTP